MPTLSRRSLTLAVCAAVVAALLAVAAFAPLPVSIVQPGLTVNVLGSSSGTQVITISGAPVRTTGGQLRMVTIQATSPDAPVHFIDVAKAWFNSKKAAMPRDSVYPSGGSVKAIEKANLKEMTDSQEAATTAALGHLGLSPSK